MIQPDFSVIIPAFNRAAFLPFAIDSILRQNSKACEIIVVDDGSTDNTPEIAQQYRGRICYMRQENRGVSAARNVGIRAANGQWVAFLDSDDEWNPGYLGRLSLLIANYPQAVGVVFNSVAEAATGERIVSFEERGLTRWLGNRGEVLVEEPFALVMAHHITTLQSTAFKRETLIQTRLFDESLTIAEDLDMIAQMAICGPFVICSEIGARVIRRQEVLVNLSAQLVRSAFRTRLSWARVYGRFLAEKKLPVAGEAALRRKYASNQRALGNLYLRTDAPTEARSAYQMAWHLDHSTASLVRLALSWFPAGVGRRLLHKEDNVDPGTSAKQTNRPL